MPNFSKQEILYCIDSKMVIIKFIKFYVNNLNLFTIKKSWKVIFNFPDGKNKSKNYKEFLFFAKTSKKDKFINKNIFYNIVN